MAISGSECVANLSISVGGFDGSADLAAGSGSLIYINGVRQLLPEEQTQTVIVTSFLGRENVNKAVKYEKSVMLSLVLGNGEPLKEATGSDIVGVLPPEYRPAADVHVPAFAGEKSSGEGSTVPCILHIDTNGTMTVSGDAEMLRQVSYIFASTTYLSA